MCEYTLFNSSFIHLQVPGIACQHLLALFKHSIDAGIQFMKEHPESLNIPPPALSSVSTITGILGGFIEIIARHGGFMVPSGSSSAEPAIEEKSVTFAEDFERELRPRRISCIRQNPKQLVVFLGKVFVFAYTWAFGGALESHGSEQDYETDDKRFDKICRHDFFTEEETARQVFDVFVRDLFTVTGDLGVALPSGNHTLFSYYIDVETGTFAKWDALVPPVRALIAKSITEYFQPTDVTTHTGEVATIDHSMVPTLDTIRYSFLIALMAVNKQPVLLTGGMGVGKTVLITDVLTRLSHRGGTSTNAGTILGAVFRSGGKNLVESILEASVGPDYDYDEEEDGSEPLSYEKVTFSAHTTAARVRSFMESKLIKRGREALGPRQGLKVCFFPC